MICTTEEELKQAYERKEKDIQFRCGDCGKVKPVRREGGTGYGLWDQKPGLPICYECCSERHRQDMIDTGKATMYLVHRSNEVPDYNPKIHCTNHGWHVQDWPGGLDFRAIVHKGRHNIAGTRYDVWFWGPDGHRWYGVQYGENTQIVHCRRTKEKKVA